MSDYFIEEMLPLHLVATGLIYLTRQQGNLSAPYPLPLQRGLDHLCAIALQRNEQPPQGVIDLLDWSRNRPISQWPLEIAQFSQSSNDFLLIEGRPTTVCEELACLKSDVEDEITENSVMKGALNICRERELPPLYVKFRRLLIDKPVLTPLAILHEKRDLRGLEEIVDRAYEPAPPAYYHGGTYTECKRCHSLLVKNKQGQLCCEDLSCREEGPTLFGRIWHEEVLQLKRGLRRFVTRPGLAEVRLFKKLQHPLYHVELWPDFDAYDLKITVKDEVWAVDVKDWANPFLLASSINEKGEFRRSSKAPWDRAFWVFPNARNSSNGFYMKAFKSSCRQLDRKVEAAFESGLVRKVRTAR